MANKSQNPRDNKGLKKKKTDDSTDMRPHMVAKRQSPLTNASSTQAKRA